MEGQERCEWEEPSGREAGLIQAAFLTTQD